MSNNQPLTATKQQVTTKLLTDLSGTLVLLFTLIPGLIYVYLFFTNNPIIHQDPKTSTFHQLLQTTTLISFTAGVLMLLASIQTLFYTDNKFLRQIPPTNRWGHNPILKTISNTWEFLNDTLMTIPYGIMTFGKTEEQINLNQVPARQFLIIQAAISGALSLIFADIFTGSWLPINPLIYLSSTWVLAIIIFLIGANNTKQSKS